MRIGLYASSFTWHKHTFCARVSMDAEIGITEAIRLVAFNRDSYTRVCTPYKLSCGHRRDARATPKTSILTFNKIQIGLSDSVGNLVGNVEGKATQTIFSSKYNCFNVEYHTYAERRSCVRSVLAVPLRQACESDCKTNECVFAPYVQWHRA